MRDGGIRSWRGYMPFQRPSYQSKILPWTLLQPFSWYCVPTGQYSELSIQKSELPEADHPTLYLKWQILRAKGTSEVLKIKFVKTSVRLLLFLSLS